MNTPLYIPVLEERSKFKDYRYDVWGDSFNWWKNRDWNTIKYLVLHHSVTNPTDNPKDDVDYIAHIHKQRGWCFPLDTEILTDNGWKNYHQFSLKKDKVATYKDGVISFELANKIVFNERQETARATTLNADLEFSLNHRVYTGSGNETSFKVRKWKEEVKQRRGNVVCKVAGNYIGDTSKEPKYKKEFYALAASVAADGWFYKKKGKVNGIGFDFAKKREADFLARLLEETGVNYTTPSSKRGYYRYRIKKESIQPLIEILEADKSLPFWLVHLPREYRQSILNAYITHDGWNNTHGENGRETDKYECLVSINKKNIDTLQAIAISLGKRATITKINRDNPRRDIYRLSIVDRDDVYVDLRDREISFSYQPTWDVDLGGKLIIIRHNGKVSVTHNSGIGYHFVITADGTVWYVGDISTQRANVADKNHLVIGVCLVGDFTKTNPTDEQILSAHDLSKYLLFDVSAISNFNDWSDLVGHKELQATQCPGDNWKGVGDSMYERIKNRVPYTPQPQPEPIIDWEKRYKELVETKEEKEKILKDQASSLETERNKLQDKLASQEKECQGKIEELEEKLKNAESESPQIPDISEYADKVVLKRATEILFGRLQKFIEKKFGKKGG